MPNKKSQRGQSASVKIVKDSATEKQKENYPLESRIRLSYIHTAFSVIALLAFINLAYFKQDDAQGFVDGCRTPLTLTTYPAWA